jgi:hypothetical protein
MKLVPARQHMHPIADFIQSAQQRWQSAYFLFNLTDQGEGMLAGVANGAWYFGVATARYLSSALF